MTENPPFFAETPADGAVGPLQGSVPSDALSDQLDRVRLRGERIYRCAPNPPVGIEFGSGVRALHLIEHGTVRVRVSGQPHEHHVSAGDLVLLPHGQPHSVVVGDPQQVRHLQIGDLRSGSDRSGDPATGQWLTGTFSCDELRGAPLLATLPTAVVLRASPGDPPDWLRACTVLLAREVVSPRPGASVMVSRILDLLFVQTLRAWAAGPDARPGWLAAAMDANLGRALAAIHQDPRRMWTVDDLAHLANLSRSSFASRFTRLLGEPPAAYLTARRLDHAADLLRTSRAPVSTIAAAAGYTSAAAFTRAFTKRFDASPLHWRNQAG